MYVRSIYVLWLYAEPSFLWLAGQRPAGVKVRVGWPKQADGLHKDEQVLVLFYWKGMLDHCWRARGSVGEGQGRVLVKDKGRVLVKGKGRVLVKCVWKVRYCTCQYFTTRLSLLCIRGCNQATYVYAVWKTSYCFLYLRTATYVKNDYSSTLW